MKKVFPVFLTLILVITCLGTSFAQVRKIPSEVTEAFKQKYPTATNVEWRDKLSNFSAAFESDNEHYQARFNSKGEWQLTENEIEEGDLPEEVKEGYDKSKFADWEIGKIHKIELSDGAFQYRIEAVKNDVRKKNLYFNSEGRLVKDRITI
ncbi:MAG: PepSY-like domain-containing protein [Chitinophagaceae bacterium]|nr:PepSY-like domain-containing protein [Chitinophagaceae bacterium]